MRNKWFDARRSGAFYLLLVAFCVALASGLSVLARQGNANNSNAPANNGNAATATPAPHGSPNAATNANLQSSATPAGGNTANTNNANANLSNANRGDDAGTTTSAAEEKQCGQTVHQKPAQYKADAKLSDLTVIKVTRADTTKESERNEAGLYNTICVQVDNLAAWAAADPVNNDPQKFFLYLNTYALKAVHARQEARGSNFLRFDLQQTDDKATQQNWRSILNRPKLFPTEPRPVTVSIGYDADPSKSEASEEPISTDVVGDKSFLLVVVDPIWFIVFLFFFVAALVLFFWLAVVSDLLRDDGPRPEGVNKKGRPNRRPFSLGRTQMAFWFFIAIVCYVFIWMVTSNYNTITSTVLILMGVSAGTAFGSVLITNSKSDEADQRRAEYQAEKDRLNARIAELEAKQNASPPQKLSSAEESELKASKKRLYNVTQMLAGASRGFATDILSDADGVSFHRFQIIAWTIALGFVFFAQVFNYLLMPEFDATLLALMGISAGTYLGFKFPEKQA